MPPKARDGNGRYLSSIEAARQRGRAARARSQGWTFQRIADEFYNGNRGTAFAEVAKFWADQPRETVEEIRAMMLAKIDDLEQEVRQVMARRHVVVSDGRVMIDHERGCFGLLKGGDPCSCPPMIDDKPIYEGVAQVRALVETQLKLIPGLAAPKQVEVLTDDDIDRAIAEERAALAQRGETGQAGGTASAAPAPPRARRARGERKGGAVPD